VVENTGIDPVTSRVCVSVSFSQSAQRATCDYQFWTPSDGRQAVRFAAHSSSFGVCATDARERHQCARHLTPSA